MRWKSDGDRYGAVAMAMHWLTAAAILALLGSGLVMADVEEPGAKTPILVFHAFAGLATGLLTVLRLLWWFVADDRPAHVAMPRWQAMAASIVHGLFYVLILAMVASGVAMMILSGAGEVIITAQGALPDFNLYAPRQPHGIGAWVMIALIVVHVGAALYHHLVLRDGLVGRMAGR